MAVWEYTGQPIRRRGRHEEPLVFESLKLATRSYKWGGDEPHPAGVATEGRRGSKGRFVNTYRATDISEHMWFLEMFEW